MQRPEIENQALNKVFCFEGIQRTQGCYCEQIKQLLHSSVG